LSKSTTHQGPTGRTGVFQLDRAGKISLIMLIVVTGFVASVFYHYVLGVWNGRPYPYNTPLFKPEVHGTDYTNNIQFTKDLNPYLGPVASTWYPVLNLLFFVFSLRIGPGHTMVMPLGLYTVLVVMALAWFSFMYLKTERLWEHLTGTFVFTFMTYPILFALDRGNPETLMLILLLLFTYCYQRRQFLISAVFLALAITTKLYPLFLLGLYLPEKRYREIGLTIGLSIALTLACLMCFKGGFLPNLEFVLTGGNLRTASALTGNLPEFLVRNNYVQRSVALFTGIKVILVETGKVMGVNMRAIMIIYFATAVVTAILVAGYVTFVEHELWKRAALLVIAMLLLPPLSTEYKMVYLLIPLFLFVNSSEKSRADTIYALLFGLLLIPKDYYLFPMSISDSGVHDISLAVFLNPAIMLLMSSMIIADGLRRWREARGQRHPRPLPVEQSLASR
jgi:hypothetical protein